MNENLVNKGLIVKFRDINGVVIVVHVFFLPLKYYPIQMCIKPAPYLHQKSVSWAFSAPISLIIQI